MSLVGDVIIGARELFPDLPDTIPGPTISTAVDWPSLSPTNPLPVGQYFFVARWITPWGISSASNEFSVTMSSGAIFITLSNTNLPYPVTGIRIYFGTAAGAANETQFVDFSGVGTVVGNNMVPQFGIQDFNQVILNVTGTFGYPPTRNTAYLPDANGSAVSAYAIYRWLNDGLKLAATINNGGLPDFTGAPTVSGQPLYQMTGQWKRVDTAWYDGYPVFLGRKTDIFRKNKVTGWSGTINVYQSADRVTLEVWPQPSRTAVSTTLTNPISATDTVATIGNTGFGVAMGQVMIDNEIMSYGSISGTTLIQLTRGLAGTRSVAHASGAPVNELNLLLSGYRVPSDYAVGDATQTFFLPAGWEQAMETYLLHRFKKAEQQMKEAKELLNEFTATVQQLVANAQIMGPRQIQVNAGRGVETYPGLGSPFGGVIVP